MLWVVNWCVRLISRVVCALSIVSDVCCYSRRTPALESRGGSFETRAYTSVAMAQYDEVNQLIITSAGGSELYTSSGTQYDKDRRSTQTQNGHKRHHLSVSLPRRQQMRGAGIPWLSQ
ncbi:hypothetical protein BD413DRAFT_560773 [Trametes elegans]|nr:hypothetical protein BD413DRAFT_560773 [Trametes elegans]